MNDLISSSSLAALVSAQPDERYWLVVEQHSETLRRLYELDATPDITWLFDETRYASARDIGPLVVAAQPGTALWNAFAESEGAAPLSGIVVSSQVERDVVIAHLRHRLEARFYGNRCGLLRYYDPWVAAHLFTATSSSSWLEPLTALYWHGGTFRQRAQHGATWYAYRPTSTAGTMVQINETGDPISLTPDQEERLETFVAQYPLWQHVSKNSGLDERSAEHARRFVAALEESKRLSIPEHELLDFVLLRFEHSQEPLPQEVDTYPPEARLAALQQHFHPKEENTIIGRDRA
ncbi:DUF4123 domain-containing protein [Billgrantia ethanolica]|uniref:DUF4123 domain-containing protein n=1 Tax=Billgrantia ethanolica TaxID=2733486 RepID=A0ABS9A0Y2_9GAMM|nr:DUF4123 domain-containing protein [Halomonas ethanolica]MCE8002275.1 DUF4123 domain-containing protein [Halomonas ethanolica]